MAKQKDPSTANDKKRRIDPELITIESLEGKVLESALTPQELYRRNMEDPNFTDKLYEEGPPMFHGRRLTRSERRLWASVYNTALIKFKDKEGAGSLATGAIVARWIEEGVWNPEDLYDQAVALLGNQAARDADDVLQRLFPEKVQEMQDKRRRQEKFRDIVIRERRYLEPMPDPNDDDIIGNEVPASASQQEGEKTMKTEDINVDNKQEMGDMLSSLQDLSNSPLLSDIMNAISDSGFRSFRSADENNIDATPIGNLVDICNSVTNRLIEGSTLTIITEQYPDLVFELENMCSTLPVDENSGNELYPYFTYLAQCWIDDCPEDEFYSAWFECIQAIGTQYPEASRYLVVPPETVLVSESIPDEIHAKSLSSSKGFIVYDNAMIAAYNAMVDKYGKGMPIFKRILLTLNSGKFFTNVLIEKMIERGILVEYDNGTVAASPFFTPVVIIGNNQSDKKGRSGVGLL